MQEYYRNFSEDKKKKNERKNMLTSEIKICQMNIKKEKKNIWEIISIKEKLFKLFSESCARIRKC